MYDEYDKMDRIDNLGTLPFGLRLNHLEPI